MPSLQVPAAAQHATPVDSTNSPRAARSSCAARIWSSVTVRKVPPDARTARRICLARGGRGSRCLRPASGRSPRARRGACRLRRGRRRPGGDGLGLDGDEGRPLGDQAVCVEFADGEVGAQQQRAIADGDDDRVRERTAEVLPQLVDVRLRAVQEVRVVDVARIERAGFIRCRAGRLRRGLAVTGDELEVRTVRPDLLDLLGGGVLGDVHRAFQTGACAVRGDRGARVAAAVGDHPAGCETAGQLRQHHRAPVLEGERRHQEVELGGDGFGECDQRGAALAERNSRCGERQCLLVTPQ